MSNRKAATKVFLEGIEAILPGSKNTQYYKDYLGNLTDEQFDKLIKSIESGNVILPLFQPNLTKPLLDVTNNIELAKKWGHDFFEHLWLTDANDPTLVIKTPKKYMLLELPMRRQAQTLEQKMSVPMTNQYIDDLTGQPTGESKGSALTFPELQVLNSEGLDNVNMELLKFRGGDVEAFDSLDRKIVDTGSASMAEVNDGQSRVKSTETLQTLLKSAHIGNNL